MREPKFWNVGSINKHDLKCKTLKSLECFLMNCRSEKVNHSKMVRLMGNIARCMFCLSFVLTSFLNGLSVVRWFSWFFFLILGSSLNHNVLGNKLRVFPWIVRVKINHPLFWSLGSWKCFKLFIFRKCDRNPWVPILSFSNRSSLLHVFWWESWLYLLYSQSSILCRDATKFESFHMFHTRWGRSGLWESFASYVAALSDQSFGKRFAESQFTTWDCSSFPDKQKSNPFVFLPETFIVILSLRTKCHGGSF